MESKTCGECKYWYAESVGKCRIFTHFDMPANRRYCIEFEQCKKPKPTNGDRIRQGGDEALIDFADGIRRKMCHYCAFFTDKTCVDKTGDCWEGVRAWLNSPAESEGREDK